MSTKIETYAELQKMIRKALREQNPEWIDAHGESAICDSYEARFAKLLVLFGAIQGQGRVEHAPARQRVASAAVLPKYAERLRERHAERGILSTDAPLSGGAGKKALLDV
jgi:hypothetical protein